MLDITKIVELIRAVDASSLTALEISEGDMRIRLEKAGANPPVVNLTPGAVHGGPIVPPAPPAQALIAEDEEDAPPPPPVAMPGECEVKSPMVGIFHAAKGAQVGVKLKCGETCCIIEAMKLMNEIAMEQDGEITFLAASEGDLVEYGQILLKYNPM